jgi:hypothetical protein
MHFPLLMLVHQCHAGYSLQDDAANRLEHAHVAIVLAGKDAVTHGLQNGGPGHTDACYVLAGVLKRLFILRMPLSLCARLQGSRLPLLSPRVQNTSPPHLNNRMVVQMIVWQRILFWRRHLRCPIAMQEARLYHLFDEVTLVSIHFRVRKESCRPVLEQCYSYLCDDKMDGACQHHDYSIGDWVCHVQGALVAEVCHEFSKLSSL